jgi:predicted lipase
MPILHSHTHWQAPQANTQPKAYQRVCLSNRTDKETQQTVKPRQKEGQLVTAPTQKAGFRVPKTVLWLIKH